MPTRTAGVLGIDDVWLSFWIWESRCQRSHFKKMHQKRSRLAPAVPVTFELRASNTGARTVTAGGGHVTQE